MTTETNTTRRRALSLMAGGVAAASSMAAVTEVAMASADAELLRLDTLLRQEYARYVPLRDEKSRLYKIYAKRRDEDPQWIAAMGFADRDACHTRISAEVGYEPACEAWHASLEIILSVIQQIADTPAQSLAGLLVKVRAVEFDVEYDPGNIDSSVAFTSLLDDIERLAAMEPRA